MPRQQMFDVAVEGGRDCPDFDRHPGGAAVPDAGSVRRGWDSDA